jgi:hypothetical protein
MTSGNYKKKKISLKLLNLKGKGMLYFCKVCIWKSFSAMRLSVLQCSTYHTKTAIHILEKAKPIDYLAYLMFEL